MGSGCTRELFGHPRGLSFLFATEMWERFSYYGMRALLVLYLVKYLLLPENAAHVIGLESLRSGFEAVFGPLDAQPFASQIYGSYTALVYLTPLLGGFLADRVLGQRKTVVIGASLMALGHFMMAFEPLLLFALLTLIVANGLFKPNISTQVGGLYAEGDPRRDRAYSIFYVGINLGAFMAPLICGTLGERWGWHYGFGAAGVGMVIGLLIYLRGLRELPPDAMQRAKAAPAEHAPMSKEEWSALFALLALFLPNTLFWAAYEQQGNSVALWIDSLTDRSITLLAWRGEIPVTWFQAINPLMIFAFTPLVVMLWERQSAQGREPSTVIKMALGCALVALSYLVMALVAFTMPAGEKSSWLWLLLFFAIITVGELYLSPIGLSLVSKIAPARILSLTMGAWFSTVFLGNFLAGWLGSYWSSMQKPHFFLMIAGVAFAAAVSILLLNKPLRKSLRHSI